MRDQNGEPLIGVTVKCREPHKVPLPILTEIIVWHCQQTDTNWNSLYIGYNTVVLTPGSRNSLDVTLEEDVKALDEVVVVAERYYAETDLVGAVDHINSEALARTFNSVIDT